MVGLRLVYFDYPTFFRLQALPNHDMYQAASLFTTNMHAIRLGGDIAWWNPITDGGHAQYYQSFLAPLAPTPSHIAFILWTQLVRALGLLGIVIPEYFQYLTMTYVLLPFLTFWAFALFASHLFRQRVTVVLVSIVYAFSGIGLWNAAWFYFQEPFSLFLLLAAFLGALQRPTERRLLFLLAAGLIQLTSLNYWTLYNSWFVAIVLAAYWWTHRNQFRRLGVRICEIVRARRATAAITLIVTLLVAAIWLVIIGTTAIQQSGNYVRTNYLYAEPRYSVRYTVQEAYDVIGDTRQLTTELFNPNIHRVIEHYSSSNPMHSARYIGTFLMPLLAMIPFYPWRRKERWLVVSALGVLIICLAPPFILRAWEIVPFMDQIGQLFWFYTQYWQLMLVLLAGASLDVLLRGAYDAATRRRFIVVTLTIVVTLSLALLYLSIVSQQFPAFDQSLEANLRFLLVTGIACTVILQYLLFPAPARRSIFVLVLLGLALADLSRYFYDVNLIDSDFTNTIRGTARPLSAEQQAALRQPWDEPDTSLGFSAGAFENMPVANDLWPTNRYLRHEDVLEALNVVAFRETYSEEARVPNVYAAAPPLDFYSQVVFLSDPAQTPTLFDDHPGLLTEMLLLHGKPVQGVSAPDTTQGGTPPEFSYEWREWLYNSFAFDVAVPASGWLLIRQVHDPAWRLTVDGQPVQAMRGNIVGMAIPLSEGYHTVRMDYRPLTRRLYWIAGVVLEITLLAFVVLSLRSSAPNTHSKDD
jgi:hypothetical protein